MTDPSNIVRAVRGDRIGTLVTAGTTPAGAHA
jgi:hypothetical protein